MEEDPGLRVCGTIGLLAMGRFGWLGCLCERAILPGLDATG